MSSDIPLLKVSNFYEVEGAPVLNVPSSLSLVGLLVVPVLVSYCRN